MCAINYAKALAIDESMNPLQNAASPVVALRTWTVENGVISSVINLHPNTTKLEVAAFGGQGVAIKWIPTTDTTSASVVSSGLAGANFDNFVPAGTYRTFVVPRETAGLPINPNVQKGSIFGLYQRLAWINKGGTASSIIANEY
jgi:hypothetical protein